jgi:DNA-directed RNA polymerase subunit K/omega|uniref:DNA-directed RNA polymerase subunit omega n=1 Tax=candidate division WOR-3 bacterium TaxID=2052148 RepID=A0A7V6CNA9_UNCW3
MEDLHIPQEKIHIEKDGKKYNKYEIILAASKLARKYLELIREGKMEPKENVYLYALKQILSGEVKIEKEE